MIRKIVNKIFSSIYSILSVLIFLAIWEISVRIGWLDSLFLTPFSKVVVTIWKMMLTGELFKHISVSLVRAIIGLGLGILVAIPSGLIIGWFKKIERFIDPLLQTFRQTFSLTLLPVFFLLFGPTEKGVIAVIFWEVQWPLLLTTIDGVKNIDPLLLNAARSTGISSFGLFRKVIFPAALPFILTGIRLSATLALLVLIPAEMLGANSGLGSLLSSFGTASPKKYAAIIIMSILGLIVNYSLIALEKKVLQYREELPGG